MVRIVFLTEVCFGKATTSVVQDSQAERLKSWRIVKHHSNLATKLTCFMVSLGVVEWKEERVVIRHCQRFG